MDRVVVGEIKIFIKLKEEKRLFFFSFQKQIYKKPPIIKHTRRVAKQHI